MSTPFPFTRQQQEWRYCIVAPLSFDSKYLHEIPNELLQLEQWLKKNKTPLFFYDPYKERKKRSLRSFFKRRIATAFAPISFVETFVCHFLLHQAFLSETPPLLYRYRDWLSDTTFTTSNAEHRQHSNLLR